jgi:hypothetical protein
VIALVYSHYWNVGKSYYFFKCSILIFSSIEFKINDLSPIRTIRNFLFVWCWYDDSFSFTHVFQSWYWSNLTLYWRGNLSIVTLDFEHFWQFMFTNLRRIGLFSAFMNNRRLCVLAFLSMSCISLFQQFMVLSRWCFTIQELTL